MKPSSPISSTAKSPPVEAPSLGALSSLLTNTGTQRAAAHPNDNLLTNLLDDLACALLIVDRSRVIHYANAAGQEVLSQGVFLRNQDGILAATPHARPMLNLVIATALHHADYPDAARKNQLRHVILSDEEGISRIAYVRALALPEGGPGGRSRSHAMITLPVTHGISVDSAAAFAQLYGLTPTEQRVLVHVANGETLKSTGAALRIASATVTTHLKHIFDKTGVRRQSEVVALFLRSLPPLVG